MNADAFPRVAWCVVLRSVVHSRLRLVVVLLAAVVTGGAIVAAPQLRNATLDANAIHDASIQPERLSACGRSWTRDATARTFGIVALREQTHEAPVLVATGPFAGCPEGACTDVAQDAPCATVVWVRVGSDAYLGYALAGGP